MTQIAGKLLTTQCSFTDHVKHKIVSKITWRMHSTNHCQL